ncbi:MAG TPA: M20/M25/M40 family metallo-hydrolase, partial [Pyrinomonadaceae bacterium]|nr:M20/M25/M40 family metallo-hydrolase [Pyrinomonadaceae bacterium]
MKKLLLAVALLALCVAASAVQESNHKDDKGASARPSSKIINAEQLLEDVRILSADAMEGRATATQGSAMARAYIMRRFGDAGAMPLGTSYERSFQLTAGKGGKAHKKEQTGVNLVAYVRGKSHPARFIVVTAHYDHLGVRDGKIYNGADDNASGVATLLQLAAHLSRERPDNSVVFAALDAEEVGLLGAHALVAQLKAEKRDVILNVNLDMVGHSERGELYASGSYHTPALRPLLERVAARAPVRLLIGHDRPEQGQDDWTKQSDQYAFHRAGIPFVYFG